MILIQAVQIRDMTSVFIGRAELLPPGETVEQHTTWQKEEADAVQQDKENQDPRTGGLFKGCFKPRPQRAPSMHPIRDQEDGVDRCPMCSWELEDGECTQCGLFMDDNGELTWGDSFTGFSDMDEMSERDMSGEDLDAEMELEDGFDGYDEQMDAWGDYYNDEQSFMMQRFLEQRGRGQPAGFRPPPARRMTHSEAGSMRSYSQSIISDMYTEEMDTVEEEDEEGLDEDSSMNDFIDDEEGASSTSQSASSTPGQTPQPSAAPARSQTRVRRIVQSDASSSIASIAEEEDEEDQGPIRRGQRNRAQTRALNRANGSREPSGAPSSTSTDTSGEQELDEDTQALLQADGWMLQHNGLDEEMDEDDDSDGGRTTVGWDATAISNDRFRMGGSLTPTADRPRPNAPIRPPSRVSNSRFIDASRGLRRRSSIISTSTVHYEDGEADDDDSDLDQDGDITMAMNALRQRRSRLQMRANPGLSSPNNRFAPPGGPAAQDEDESDTSQNGSRRPGSRARPQEYNPRISWMFANYQRSLQEHQGGPTLLDLEPRSTTPIARPRTANRNRTSPAPQFSPFMAPAPARLRTPLMDNSSNNAAATRNPISPPRRSFASPVAPPASLIESAHNLNRVASTSSSSNASGILTPNSSAATSQQSVNATSQAQTAAAVDFIDRPVSRVGARPPSAAGRRNSAAFSPVYPVFPHNNVGLNIQGQILQNQRLRNPWGAFIQQPHGLRSRTSRPALRDQSSTATLRAVNSRANIRDTVNPPQGMRTQASRIDLRAQPSRRRLNNQSSTRTLRASELARPPPSPTTNTGAVNQPPRPTRLTPDEREVLARELVNTRMRALGGAPPPTVNTARTNPFAQGMRRTNVTSDGIPTSTVPGVPQHTRSNSNESMNSVNSSSTAQGGPPSPGLNRRRSSRNMSSIAPPVLPPTQEQPPAPTMTYSSNYFRARQGSFTGANPPYQSPLNTNTRPPMVAAAGPLI